MGSSPSINIPPQQGYGEAMSESLRAQVDLLSGQGDFGDTGGLQSLLETYEAPLRQSTAQIDTDVLGQTLLGEETLDFTRYVKENPDLQAAYEQARKVGTTSAFGQPFDGTIEDFGRIHYQKHGRQQANNPESTRVQPKSFRTSRGMVDLLGDARMLEGEDRTAGFDESGKFLGL